MTVAFSRRRLDGVTLLVTGLALGGIGLTAVGLVAPLVLIVACYAIAGAGNGLENVGCDAAIGENVEKDKLGRVVGAVYGPIFLVAGGGLLTVALAAYLSTTAAKRPPHR